MLLNLGFFLADIENPFDFNLLAINKSPKVS